MNNLRILQIINLPKQSVRQREKNERQSEKNGRRRKLDGGRKDRK